MPSQVELQNCGIGAAGVRSIAEAADSYSGSSSNRASAMSLPELAANGVLPESSQETVSSSRLHILRLDGNAAGPGAGKALQPLLGHVRELYVSSMGLGDEGVLPDTYPAAAPAKTCLTQRSACLHDVSWDTRISCSV